MDRSSETNGTACWNDGKEKVTRDQVRPPTETDTCTISVLDSSNKTKINEKVTEWLSLDLLGSLLQISDGALQA